MKIQHLYPGSLHSLISLISFQSSNTEGDHTRAKTQVTSKIGGLMAFAKVRSKCLGCKMGMDKDGVALCKFCKPNESSIYQKEVGFFAGSLWSKRVIDILFYFINLFINVHALVKQDPIKWSHQTAVSWEETERDAKRQCTLWYCNSTRIRESAFFMSRPSNWQPHSTTGNTGFRWFKPSVRFVLSFYIALLIDQPASRIRGQVWTSLDPVPTMSGQSPWRHPMYQVWTHISVCDLC